MKLEKMILENFRSYKEKIEIQFDELTTIIGRNDIGKSTILEALEIFFNNETVKIDKNDICLLGEEKVAKITCIFKDFSSEILIDSSRKTNLEKEYLLNENKKIEIIHKYDCNKSSVKPEIFIHANSPQNPKIKDLILKKSPELKSIYRDLEVDENVDLRVNSEIRQAIYRKVENLQFSLQEIPLKNDIKDIWESLKKELPMFVLFQSDRSSSDGDSEVQDPMKLAIKEALDEVSDELEIIKEKVKLKAEKVAKKTIEKLEEMNSELAKSLIPRFKEEPKWNNLFKLSLEDDNNIPINKRGSGVRRLILLNFFRAQAEKLQEETHKRNIIYAIEEPETSQHPNNQKMLVKSLIEISGNENCQVLLTTHVPELAKMINVKNLRYITIKDNKKVILSETTDIYEEIANELGILPDKRIKLLICVEGPNDVNFLTNISKNISLEDATFKDITKIKEIAIIPLGGGTLEQWVNQRYLKDLDIPEFHLYDNDVKKYQKSVDNVNQRKDGSFAMLMKKREMENYIPVHLINNFFGINISKIEDEDDVPNLIMDEIMDGRSSKFVSRKIGKIKKELNLKVVENINLRDLIISDSNGHIKFWFEKINELLNL